MQALKAISNGFSAEYGRFSGGVVVLVTRAPESTSFTVRLMSTSRMISSTRNDWSSNRYGSAKDAFHNNICGGTARNVLNHMNTGNPDTNESSSSFGYITTQAGTPRVVLVAAKLVF